MSFKFKDNTYMIFYEPTSTETNVIASRIVNKDVYGPVILLKRDTYDYITPTQSELLQLGDIRITNQHNDCTIL